MSLESYEYLKRGKAYQDNGDYDSAIAEFTQAIQIDPNEHFNYFARGCAYDDKGDLESAIADFTESIRLSPDDEKASVYQLRGTAYRNNGEYDRSIEDFTELLRISPDDPKAAYKGRGAAYFCKGENDLALADFEAALRFGPDNEIQNVIKQIKGTGSTESSETSAKQGCYVATCVYGSYDCPEVWTLRRYRDGVLSKSWFGRRFINVYYAISPKAVKLFGSQKWFVDLCKPKIDRLVCKLRNSGI